MAADSKNAIKSSSKIARDDVKPAGAGAAAAAKVKDKKDYSEDEKLRDAINTTATAKGVNRKEVFTNLCSVTCGGHSIKTSADLLKAVTHKDGLGMTLSEAQQKLLGAAFTTFAAKDTGLNLAAFIKLTTVA